MWFVFSDTKCIRSRPVSGSWTRRGVTVPGVAPERKKLSLTRIFSNVEEPSLLKVNAVREGLGLESRGVVPDRDAAAALIDGSDSRVPTVIRVPVRRPVGRRRALARSLARDIATILAIGEVRVSRPLEIGYLPPAASNKRRGLLSRINLGRPS